MASKNLASMAPQLWPKDLMNEGDESKDYLLFVTLDIHVIP